MNTDPENSQYAWDWNDYCDNMNGVGIPPYIYFEADVYHDDFVDYFSLSSTDWNYNIDVMFKSDATSDTSYKVFDKLIVTPTYTRIGYGFSGYFIPNHILGNSFEIGVRISVTTPSMELGRFYSPFMTISPSCTLTEVSNFEPEGSTFRIYPNPGIERLIIECNERLSSIRLCNSVGLKIKEFSDVTNNTSIDLDGVGKGCYFIQAFSSSGKTYTEKLLIR